MKNATPDHLQLLHVSGELLQFHLHGKPHYLLVEDHMRRHITREAERFDGFSCMAGAPDAATSTETYTPELYEMTEAEHRTLIKLFAEDIVADENE